MCDFDFDGESKAMGAHSIALLAIEWGATRPAMPNLTFQGLSAQSR
jgi:hypothetical protein